jgi:hypothetical protein
MMTPSSVNNDVAHRYQQQAVQQQTQHLPQPQAMTQHGQPQQLLQNEPPLVLNNAPYQPIEPVMIEKDQALQHDLQEYYAKQQANGPDSCV